MFPAEPLPPPPPPLVLLGSRTGTVDAGGQCAIMCQIAQTNGGQARGVREGRASLMSKEPIVCSGKVLSVLVLVWYDNESH